MKLRRFRPPRGTWGAAVLLVVGTLSPALRAETTSRSAEGEHVDPRPRVDVIVIGGAEARRRAESMLGGGALAPYQAEWFEVARFDPERLLVESASGASARCFIDLSGVPEVKLYFADQRARRFLLRSVSLSAGSSEIDREVLSQIVALSLQALLLPDTASLTREQARSLIAPAPTASANSSERAEPPPIHGRERWSVALSLFYMSAAHSRELPVVHGPGLSLAIGSRSGRLRGAFDVRLRYELPQEYGDTRIALHLSTLALQTGAELLWPVWPEREASTVWLGPRLAAGVDFTKLSPGPGRASAGAIPADSRWSPSIVLSAGLLARLALGQSSAISVETSLLVDPRGVEYALTGPGGSEPVIERFQARPALGFGLHRSW